MGKNKKRFYYGFKQLLGREFFEESKCLKMNGVIGLLMLPGIVFYFIDNNNSPIDQASIYIHLTAGIVFMGGFLLGIRKPLLQKQILSMQGIFICVLVGVYTSFMWDASKQIISGDMKSKMGHAPGLLAYGAAYGIKQFLNFTNLIDEIGLQRIITIQFFILGIGCDIFVMYSIFQAFKSY